MLFAAAFAEARAPEDGNGVFQLSHVPPPEGKNDRWPLRMTGERDTSGVPERIVESVGAVEETVLDYASYELTNDEGEPTSRYRTVSAHALCGGHDHLLALERCEERDEDEIESSLAGKALRRYLALADERELELADVPLLGLDPALANSAERRLLVAARIPYGLLLDPGEQFREVLRPLEGDLDMLEEMPVEGIFDYHKRNCDRSRPTLLEICDLRERPGSPRRVLEFLVEVPGEPQPTYFLAWPAPPPAARHRERQLKALELALRTARRVGRGPATGLRADEFHHPHEVGYRSTMNIVDFGTSATKRRENRGGPN